MKMPVFGIVALAALFGGPIAVPAATLTITPSIITNDFVGNITLNISSLASFQTVRVERFADVNGNGVVDPGEPLMLSFLVRDGQLPLIGGVRNLNVPGDEDGATNGQMRVELFYPGGDSTLDRMEGKYLCRISHPTNGFAPVTQPYAIRQPNYPQGIRGRITDAATGQPLTNAGVVLMDSNGMGQSGTMVVSNGYYTLHVAPGNYMVIPFRDGYFGDLSAVGAAVVANQFVTHNLALSPGTLSLSGRVTDANNGNALAGIGIMAESKENNLLAFTFTDTNGNFVAKVSPGQWRIEYNTSQLPLLGYVCYQQPLSLDVTENLTGLSLTATKARALIYGNVTDEQDQPFIGAALFAQDQRGQYETDARSYPTAGAYCLGVVAGDWYAEMDSDVMGPLGYLGSNIQVTVRDDQALRADFVLRKMTVQLSGRVVDENNAPVPYIRLGIHDTDNSWMGTETDENGRFQLGTGPGTWNFNLEMEDAQARNLIGSDLSLTVTNGETHTNLIFRVAHVAAQITGRVKSVSGAPITYLGVGATGTNDGVQFFLYRETDENGNYNFGVGNGTWTINLAGDLPQRGYQWAAPQSVNVSGNNQVVDFTVQPILPLQITTTAIPDGTLNSYYQVSLNASGGQPSYNWTLTPNSAPLPFDLALRSDGMLAGNLMVEGTFTFSVRVNDNNGAYADQMLTLRIPAGPLQMNTSYMPVGEVGLSYNAQINAIGGSTPYSWALSPGSAPLPTGLNLSTNGTISGSPTMMGTSSFLVRVTDAARSTVDSLLSIDVAPAVQITTTSLPDGAVDSPYMATPMQAGGGVPSYSWSILSGTLPPGLTFTGEGLFTGTPTAAGPFTFTVGVADGLGGSATRAYTLTVTAGLQLLTTTLPDGTVGVPYNAQLQVANGQAPYTWSVALGSSPLPAGLTLQADGSIVGTPAAGAVGTNFFIVRVTDAAATYQQKLLSIGVNSAPALHAPTLTPSGAFKFTVSGAAGQTYQVQTSTTLTNWTTYYTTNPAAGTFEVIGPNPQGNPPRFFRVRVN